MTCSNILVTGFEAFGGETLNSSALILKALSAPPNSHLSTATLPVEFERCTEVLTDLIETLQPDVVLCLGQAGGRRGISLERVAINLDDARICDNAGIQRVDVPVCADGPNAYFTSLPIKRMLAALHIANIPADISSSAGGYVCNHLMYGLLHFLNERPEVRGGFIHVPFLPEQGKRLAAPSMRLETMVEAVSLCLRVCVEYERDVSYAVGGTH